MIDPLDAPSGFVALLRRTGINVGRCEGCSFMFKGPDACPRRPGGLRFCDPIGRPDHEQAILAVPAPTAYTR